MKKEKDEKAGFEEDVAKKPPIQSDYPLCPNDEEEEAEARTREAVKKASLISWGDQDKGENTGHKKSKHPSGEKTFREEIRDILIEECLFDYPVKVYMNHLIVKLPDLEFFRNVVNLKKSIISCINEQYSQRNEDILIEFQSINEQECFKLARSV